MPFPKRKRGRPVPAARNGAALIDFELRIDKDGLVAPYSLPLPDGGTLQIKGSIDRVDRMERDGKGYLRVVDYKSGGKEFLLSDVLNGLNMQMLIYLMCLWQNGAQRYGEVVPAGILYMPVKSTPATLGRNASAWTVAASTRSARWPPKWACCHPPYISPLG